MAENNRKSIDYNNQILIKIAGDDWIEAIGDYRE